MDEKLKQAYLDWDDAKRMLKLADELKSLAAENERLAREKCERLQIAYPRAVDDYREWVSGKVAI
jgi:hypothetical protein